jgi:hypothetical protein
VELCGKSFKRGEIRAAKWRRNQCGNFSRVLGRGMDLRLDGVKRSIRRIGDELSDRARTLGCHPGIGFRVDFFFLTVD